MKLKQTLENKFSSSLEKIKGSPIREFDTYASQFEGLIKLTLGEPDFDTAQIIKDAANKALENNRTHYALNAGVLELRQAVADSMKEKYNVDYGADEVIVTVGASAAIEHTISALTNPGDTILVVTPYFTLYDGCSYLNGCNVGYIDTLESGFKLTPELFEEHYAKYDNVKALIINYPNNPSGVSYSREELEELAAILKKYDIFVLSDEIYADISYNFKHTSLTELLPEQTILITGLSKSHAMTGWRVGFVLGPKLAIQKIAVYHMFTVSGIPTFIQDASLIALTHPNSVAYTNKMIKVYTERRNYLIPELKSLGFEIDAIDGAFYAFARIPEKYRKKGTMEFCKFLAREARVGVIPGNAFGSIYKEYIRISFAASMEDLQESIRRIKEII
ncbi:MULTISPECIES: pyridoxal phosphate-dependent aminotransferase [unclassified Gemella]|uniref:pyridoxal phosphate-dependent aminotransferase n=1 Tax=unclassified Gemella TaxID=2624949 RepID=UPI0010732CD1|nr:MULTISPECIES: aminotransferase class I/II-fold pyridoxal phosphate-dependent enzyme [unclassified Gemella]MBF0710619.1 aminotransferase class I/II-fold pyridoxal phosphate-dependent enzyme [Gemella sp. GL1.1]MBF0746402.1 aminotransferase class I/II-fold pyridoxal phosphate-dependent enzyme [Gemella sp. 19428wG2_WT2a]NYS27963.1 aminotransferase class I/II-fold pyridoxal phosphate-dependent enzyme [Gemella sp. GL1]TFU60185.1 aminotransferase class I/II-fold pyridoxal phosphate-dependent enzyme